MADLTFTTANIIHSGGSVQNGIAGATLAPGDVVYTDSDGVLQKADASTATKAAVSGVCINGGAAGQTVGYVNSGATLDAGGAVFSSGKVYVLSATAGGGKVAPIDDLTTGDYLTILGIASSTQLLPLAFNATGLTSP